MAEITVGDRIKAARLARGWSKRQLAAKAGCNPVSVSNWESNSTAPHLDKICDIAAALHTTVEALCGRAEYCSSREVMELRKENARLRASLVRIRESLMYGTCVDIKNALFPEGGEKHG